MQLPAGKTRLPQLPCNLVNVPMHVRMCELVGSRTTVESRADEPPTLFRDLRTWCPAGVLDTCCSLTHSSRQLLPLIPLDLQGCQENHESQKIMAAPEDRCGLGA